MQNINNHPAFEFIPKSELTNLQQPQLQKYTPKMSSEATPITPARFRLAIHDLPLPTLHAKAAELRNSISHLLSSNDQLREFADAGDQDCKDAIAENEVVLGRFRERIQLLREEVEGRGMRWVEDSDGVWEGKGKGGDIAVNGDAGTDGMNGVEESNGVSGEARSGRLTDEELRLLMEARMGEQDGGDEEEGGLHL
jgi:hypothetical protein